MSDCHHQRPAQDGSSVYPIKEESGTDENGQGMASGVHGYRLEAIQVETLERGFVETKWMLLIR